MLKIKLICIKSYANKVFIRELTKSFMEYDLGIVLSHEIQNKKLSEEARKRLDKAIQLFKEGKIRVLLMTGDHSEIGENYGITLAEAMKKYAIEKGIPEDKILKEEVSLETVGQLIFSRLIIDKGQFKNIYIISSDYHISRVMVISEFVFNSNYHIFFEKVATEKNPEREKKERESERTFSETFKGVKKGDINQLLEILFERHKIYNKNPEYFKKKLIKD
jgi:vancomycin permeability regulator SanA